MAFTAVSVMFYFRVEFLIASFCSCLGRGIVVPESPLSGLPSPMLVPAAVMRSCLSHVFGKPTGLGPFRSTLDSFCFPAPGSLFGFAWIVSVFSLSPHRKEHSLDMAFQQIVTGACYCGLQLPFLNTEESEESLCGSFRAMADLCGVLQVLFKAIPFRGSVL